MILPAIVALLVAPQVTQVEAVLEHRLGSANGAPEEAFGVVSDLAADDEGNVYVLDQRADAVRVFSASGEYLRTIGQRGRGPGQFNRPNHIDVHDGFVTVLNPGGRTSTFTLAGELVESTALPMGALSAERLGDVAYAAYVSGGISRDAPTPTESVIVLGSSSVDTIVTGPSSDLLFRSRTLTSLVRTSLCRLVYFSVGSRAEIWIASGIDGTLTEWRAGRSTRVAPEGAALPDSTRSRLLGTLPSQLDPDAGDLSVPPTYSSICGLERSEGDAIWVRLNSTEGRERWMAFEPATLSPTFDLIAPEGVAVRAFSGTRAYGTWSDAAGVAYVGIFRLE
ncbi:MAG: 6-bladed beta-propeller [Gemmatimonadota bacterium]|nr:6-bladed beta-propeller [Gemmatimonadota bacterium]